MFLAVHPGCVTRPTTNSEPDEYFLFSFIYIQFTCTSTCARKRRAMLSQKYKSSPCPCQCRARSSFGRSASYLVGRSWGQSERSNLLFFLGLSVLSIEREGDITAARVGVVLVRFVLLPGLIASVFSGLPVGSM
jgi:hypothetical protein